MPTPNNVRYAVTAGGQTSVWGPQTFEKHKDQLFADYPDATVVREDQQWDDGAELDGNTRFQIDTKDGSVMWGPQTFAKHRDQLLKDYPDAKISRMSMYDYGADVADRRIRLQAEMDAADLDMNKAVANGVKGDGLKRFSDRKAQLEQSLADLGTRGEAYDTARRERFENAVKSGEVQYETPEWGGLQEGETEEQHRDRTGKILEEVQAKAPKEHDWAAEAASLGLSGDALVEEMTKRRRDAEKEQKAYEKELAEAEFEYNSNPLVQRDKRIEEGKAEMQKYAEEMQAKREAISVPAFTPPGAIMNTRDAALMADKDYVRTQVAYTNALDRVHKEEMIRDHTVNSFWANAGNSLLNPESWTFGLGKLYEAGVIMDAVKDQESESAQETLKQAYLLSMADADYADQQGNKGRWGQMTGEMAQFIILNALGAGLFEGTAESVSKKVAGETAETLGRKFLGSVVKDATLAFLTENTVGAANTIAAILDRHNGHLVQNEDGTYDFADGEGWWKSIWNTEAEQFTEYFTERVGEHFGTIGGKIAGSKIGQKLGLKKVAEFIAREPASGFEAGVKNFYKLAGIQNYPGEVLEEELGIVMSNMLQWRTPGENLAGVWEGLTDGQQQADIFGGMAFSIGLMQSVPLAAHVGVKSYNAIHGERLNANLNKAETQAANAFNNKEEWNTLKDRIDTAANEDITPIIYEIASNDSMLPEEKKAALQYVDGLMRLRGFSTGVMSEMRQAVMTRRNAEARDLLGTYGQFWTEEEIDTGVKRDRAEGLEGTGLVMTDEKGRAKTEKGTTQRLQYARRITFADEAGTGFGEAFVMSEDGQGVLVKANDGKLYVIQNDSLDQMVQNGQAKDSGRVPLFMVLDQRAADMEKVRETQRMREEARNNANNLLAAAAPGTQVNIGTEGNENKATVLGYQNGQFIVQDADGQQRNVSPKDMAGYLGMAYDAKTDAEINEINGRADEKTRLLESHQGKTFTYKGRKYVLDGAAFSADANGNLQCTLIVNGDGSTITLAEYEADDILSQLDGDKADQYNGSIRQGQKVRVDLGGTEAEYAFKEAVVEDGEVIIKAIDPESGAVVDLTPEMVTNMDELMGGQERREDVEGNPVPAPSVITEESTQPTDFFDDPVANELGIGQEYVHVTPKGTRVLDRAKLWRDNPELWARWYDRQEGRTKSTRDYLEDKLKEADKDVADALNAYAAEDQGEQNPDRLEALMDDVNEKTRRQQQIKTLFDKYDAAEKSAAKTAENAQNATPAQGQNPAPAAMTPQAAATPAATPRTAEQTASEAQKALSELSKRQATTKEQGERQAIMEAKAIVLQQMLDELGAKGTLVVTRANVVEEYRKAGGTEEDCAKLEQKLAETKQARARMRGFYDHGRVFIIADDIVSAADANIAQLHEAKHLENARTGAVGKSLATGVTTAEMKTAIKKLTGSEFYDEDSRRSLADEVFANAEEIAEKEGVAAVPQRLREAGITNEEFINFVTKNIEDGRRRNGERRHLGGRDALQPGNTEVSGQEDVGGAQPQSGTVEGQVVRPDEGGRQGAGGREAEPAAAVEETLAKDSEAAVTEEITANLGGRIEGENGDVPVQFSITAGTAGVGLKANESDAKGNVTFEFSDGRVFDADHPLRVEDVKNEPNTVMGYMMNHALELGTITQEQADTIWQKYTDTLNRMLEKGSAENGGVDALSSAWQWVGETVFKTVATNSDAQYKFSLDITRVCKKNEAVINTISEVQRRLGYGITPGQVMDIYMSGIEEGYQVPCPVCYVFSRYISNGIYATIAINGQRKYGRMLVDPRTLTEEQKAERVKWWLAEKERLEAIDEKHKKQIAMAKDEVARIFKRIDQIGKQIGTMDAKAQAEARKEIKALDRRYRTALNAISQSNMAQWIKQFAIRETKDGWELYGDTFQGFPDEYALDLRLTAETIEKYPGIQRLRKSGGSAAGKEIHFAANNDIGDVTMMLGASDLKNAPNYYQEAVKATDPKEKEVLLDMAKKQFAKAVIYAAQQSLRGGQRMWSWSDNIERLAPDVFFNLIQMQMLGGALQSYSKQLEGVDLVASMGGYVNGSLMGYGNGYAELTEADIEEVNGRKVLKEDITDTVTEKTRKGDVQRKRVLAQKGSPVFEVDGKNYVLVFDDVVGIDAHGRDGKQGLFALNARLDKAGNILVGMNDIHVRTAMADDRVFFIIPWHASGMAGHILRQMLDYLKVDTSKFKPQDYTDVQEEKDVGTEKKPITPQLASFWEKHKNETYYKCGIEGGIPSGENGLLSAQQKEYRSLRDAIFVGVKEDTGRTNKNGEAIYKTVPVTEKPEMMAKINGDEFLSQVFRKVRDRVSTGMMTAGDTKYIYPYEYWDEASTYGTADVNGARYLEYCRRLGVKPKFVGKLGYKAGEDFGNFADDKGYWKLLIDRRMYKTDGTFQDLDPVDAKGYTPDLIDPIKTGEKYNVTKVADDEGVKRMADRTIEMEKARMGEIPTVDYDKDLDEAVAEYLEATLTDAQRKALNLVNGEQKPKKPKKSKKKAKAEAETQADSGLKFSVTAEQDAEYMQAVEAGDMETAQRMVRDAAAAAMPNTKVVDEDGKPAKVYHGSTWNPMEEKIGDAVFKDSYRGTASGDNGFFGRGFYFTYGSGDLSRAEAGYYGPTITEAFLDIQNPFMFNETLYEYNGKRNAGSEKDSVVILNMVKNFPALCDNLSLEIYNGEGENEGIISLEDYAKLFEDIYNNKEFIVNETDERGIVEVLADPVTHKETLPNGREVEWTDYGFRMQMYRPGKNEDARLAYTHYYLTDMQDIGRDDHRETIISVPSSLFSELFESEEFTEALKQRGYDGVMQSANGDEVVAFAPSQIKSADPVTYGDNGNVIPLSERFNPDNDDIRFSIRGVLGAQNDAVATANLDTAKEMETAGKDAKTIWLATGWEKGKDGKWRSEIPDGKAKAFPVGKRSLTVADIIDAPELFEAYPEIKDYKVTIKKLRDSSGTFSPSTKELELDRDDNFTTTIPKERKAEAQEYYNSRFWANPGKAATLRNQMEKEYGQRELDEYGIETIMHELQHAIQHIEGFAKGGSVRGQAQDYLSKAYKTRPEAVTFARAFSSRTSRERLLRFGRTKMAEYITKNAGSITEGEGEATRRLEALRDYINGLDDWGYRNLVSEGARLWSNAQQIGKSEYPRLAGETEARNVEKRRGMSEEERRNTPLSETEDVAREEQVLQFSVTAEQDEEYMDAVNAGDMEKAQRMVDEAAKAAGYTIKAFHGTYEDFNTFKPNEWQIEQGGDSKIKGYFSTDEDYAKRYGPTQEYYLKVNNPLEIPYEEKTLREWADWFKEHGVAGVIFDSSIEEDTLKGADYGDGAKTYVPTELFDSNYGFKGDGNLTARIAGSGYDAIHYPFEEQAYAPFDAAAIKSADPVTRDDNGNVIPLSERFNPQNEDIRFSVTNRNQEVFVSNAERAVEGIRMEKATPEQWLKMIEKGGGLKAGEDKWIGLSDWLKAQDRKSLTKQEVLDYIDQNKIRIEEVNYSENGEMTDEELDDIYDYGLPPKLDAFHTRLQQEFDDLLEEMDAEEAYETMAEKYGARFREAYDKDDVVDGESLQWTYIDSLMEFAGIKNAGERSSEKAINATRLDLTTRGLDNKREIALTVPTIEPWNQGDNIHFGDAGEGRAIVWIRFGDATDVKGNKTLVIDEVQSKRHEDAREMFIKQMRAKYGDDWKSKVTEEEKKKGGYSTVGKEEQPGIPAAPFENNWHELAMKRMLRYAAENGYDYVAWTTGEQQAERYSLSKVITGVETAQYPNEPGTRYVYLIQDGAPDIELHVNEEGVVTSVGSRYFSEYEGKKLSDIIGKELAVKTMATETDKYGNAEVVAEGEDLRIGGEGMKGFYDEMLPRFMNKYGKKWGVKVEDITLPGLEPSARTMHSVPVTQEMKDSVMEGQLMFSVQGQKDRMETIDRVAQDGLASVIGEDEVSNLYKDVYAAIPKDVLKPVVEQALGKDLDIRRAVKGYLHDLAAKGTENDETGLLFALYNEIRFLTGNADLTDNDARYLLWKETSDAKEGDILALAEDRAMRNRWKVGDESDLRFSAQGEFEEATGEAKEKADKRMNDAEEEYKKAKEETKQEQDETGRLWGQANDIRKAMEAQKTYDKATVDSIVRFAKEILKNGRVSALTLREASRLLTLVTNATGKSPKFASRYAEQLMDMLLDHIVGDEKAKFMKLVNVKDSTTSQSGVNKQGKLDVLGQVTMKAFRDNMNSSLEEIQRRKEELSDRINHKDKAVRDEAFAEYRGLRLAELYAENVAENLEEAKDLEKDLKDGPEETTRKARDEFKKVMGDAIRRNKMERVDMYRDLAARLADIINGSAEKAAEFREAERQRVEDIHHDANRDMKGVPTTEHRKDTRMQRFLNSDLARFFCKPLATADQMFRMIGRKAVDGMGFLYNRFIRQWDEAAGKKSRGIFQAMSELDAKASEVFGKKMRWSDLYKEERGLPQMEVDFMDGGEMKTHTLTQGNMLYIYMADKMIDGKMKLRKMGIMEEDVAAIKERLDPRFIELADWLQSEYLVEKRNKYNAVHERMFGAPMAAIENYFPIKILSNARIEEVDLGNKPDGTTLSSTTTGSILKRRKNSLALDILHTDAFSLVVEHIEQMEDWAAFAELRRDMNTLLSYKRFRNQVQNMNTIYGSGKALWDNFKDVCSILVGSYKPKVGKGDTDTLALNAAKGVTAAKISFRVNTAIKQILSFPAYLPDARPDLLAKSLATPGKSWKWCMENLPLFEKRWKSRIAGDTRLMDTESDWKLWRNNVVKTAARLGMTPNAFVDATTVAIGAKAMYDTKFARYKKEGYSDEEADKKAKQDAEILYNQTQQSSEDAFVSAMQLDRTWISVMLTTYRNSSMSYQRQLHDALRTMAKMLKPGYRNESIRFMTNQRMNEGLEEEEARAAAESQYNRQWLRSLARVAVFGYGLQLLWKIGNDMWYMLLGDDDDEKKKIFREAALSELAAPVEGLSAGNVMSDAWGAKMKEKVNEEYGIKTNNRFAKTGLGELPIISDINTMRSKFGYDKPAAISDLIDIVAQSGFGVNPRTFSDTIVAIIDACDGNLDTAKEAGLLMMRIMQVPQSTIEKFIIDEIDMTAADARKLSADELAKRYAEYKVLKNAPYTQWLYDEGTKAKRLKAAEKSFKEKVGNRMKEKAEAAPLTIDETYKDFEKGMKDYQKRLNLAKKDNDIATRDALMAQPEYREYQTWKKYQKAINRLDKSIKNTVDEDLRKEWTRRREELIQNMINEIESE